MPIADTNRLKGNYGAAYVSARLSSECLVRPVAAETDVGVDLYCETVVEGKPFLHFWVQVKAGVQCGVAPDGKTASCSFSKDHLNYWSHQPVPVFAALVPTDWPVSADPVVYVIDLTSKLLGGVPDDGNSKTLYSDYQWQPGVRSDVVDFLENAVPVATARLQCKRGVLAHVPTPSPSYVISTPWVPVDFYKINISEQIRRTAANAILFLYMAKDVGPQNDEFRRKMARLLEGYGEDPHWETWMALAISYHVDLQFHAAVRCYKKAKKSIEGDPNVREEIEWIERVKRIESLLKCAKNNAQLDGN